MDSKETNITAQNCMQIKLLVRIPSVCLGFIKINNDISDADSFQYNCPGALIGLHFLQSTLTSHLFSTSCIPPLTLTELLCIYFQYVSCIMAEYSV